MSQMIFMWDCRECSDFRMMSPWFSRNNFVLLPIYTSLVAISYSFCCRQGKTFFIYYPGYSWRNPVAEDFLCNSYENLNSNTTNMVWLIFLGSGIAGQFFAK